MNDVPVEHGSRAHVIPPRITLWYALTADVAEPALLRACNAVLTAEEAARQKAFVFEKNRHEYLVTRALCRGVLATYVGVSPAELVFTRSDHGRPALAPTGALQFNLTNTLHLVACGVSTGFAIGIDAEPLDRADDILGVADSVFTPYERDELARLPLAPRRVQAVRLWTLKEAYMKARGLGMSLPPLTFELGFDERCHLRHVEDGDLPSRWELTTREVEGHMLATCIERPDGGPMMRHDIVLEHADLAALLLTEVDTMEIWFNPSCSKCQTAVAAVEGAGEPYTLRSYLEMPPTEPELEALLTKLGKEPWEVCRMKEPIASELGLASLPKERAEWIRVMARHPILIERPILVRSDGRAVIGRSAEALEEAISRKSPSGR